MRRAISLAMTRSASLPALLCCFPYGGLAGCRAHPRRLLRGSRPDHQVQQALALLEYGLGQLVAHDVAEKAVRHPVAVLRQEGEAQLPCARRINGLFLLGLDEGRD